MTIAGFECDRAESIRDAEARVVEAAKKWWQCELKALGALGGPGTEERFYNLSLWADVAQKELTAAIDALIALEANK